jgi:hypothetical protein
MESPSFDRITFSLSFQSLESKLPFPCYLAIRVKQKESGIQYETKRIHYPGPLNDNADTSMDDDCFQFMNYSGKQAINVTPSFRVKDYRKTM